MTIAIFTMTNEVGELLSFVDTRDPAGTLVASVLFYSLGDAEAYAGTIGCAR